MAISKNALKAREIREGMRRYNDDGSYSSHIMTSGEADGMYYAHPMLFPGYENDELQVTEEWHQFEKGEEDLAFEYAMSKNEMFIFETDKEAKEFALGSWKPVEEQIINTLEKY